MKASTSANVPVVVLRSAWMMLDPESPFGGCAGDFAWLAAGTNDEHVQVGPLWRHRPRSVVPPGSLPEARGLTTCAELTAGPSPIGHVTLSEVSPAKIIFARHVRIGFGHAQSLGKLVPCLIEFCRGVAERRHDAGFRSGSGRSRLSRRSAGSAQSR